MSLEIISENAFRKAGHLFPSGLLWQSWAPTQRGSEIKPYQTRIHPGHCLTFWMTLGLLLSLSESHSLHLSDAKSAMKCCIAF